MYRELVTQAKRGDEEAFDALARLTGDRCMAIAYRILRDAHLAEDAMQTANVPAHTIDALLAALAGQPGVKAGPTSSVTVDGYRGKVVELTVTTDPAKCTDGKFYTWGSTDNAHYAQGVDEIERVYALDVNGQIVTFFARIPKRTTTEHRAELESLIASIDIQP